MSAPPAISRGKSFLFGSITAVVITVATLALLEGGASVFLFARDWLGAEAPDTALRPHTIRDTLLGWASEPGYANPDEYGAGIGLTLTREGYRTNGAARPGPADARTSVACSGDAFTFGVGVADDRHWCGLLEQVVPGIRTTNLAEPAWSLDQSVLRYRRDGAPLAAGVHIFALTDASLERGTGGSMDGWSRPYLALDGEQVTTKNVPVPAQSRGAIRRASAARAFDQLRIVQEVRRFRGIDRQESARDAADERLPLVERVIGDLAAADRARGGRLILIYIPTARAARRAGSGEARRERLAAFAKSRDIPFVDLTSRIGALRPDSLDLSYITRAGPGKSESVEGQLSTLGHAVVARVLAEEIARLPGFAIPGLAER